MRLARGQYITPTALRGPVQQLLNPGPPDYPSFVAGEAVRSPLSPDGTVAAILWASVRSPFSGLARGDRQRPERQRT